MLPTDDRAGRGARPRFWTRPTPGALHEAGAIARLAVVLGRPLMPWQYLVMRVGTERRLDDPRRYRYPVVRVSVPRQSGKTTGEWCKATHRTITRPRRQSFYTAQTGKDARKRWMDCKELVLGSPLKRFVEDGNTYGGAIRLGAGDAAITWPNGAFIAPFAPTAASLHGYTPHDVDRDELWAYDQLTGEALDGAIGPAQITLVDRQRWDWSTMGDADSTYWHELVEEGRRWTEQGDAAGAYFEWSADPDADLYDPATLADFHPALGFTIEAADLAEAAGQTEEERAKRAGVWQRAYCNLKTATRESVVDLLAFRRLADPELRIAAGAAALAFDVAYDSTQASVMIAAPAGEDGVAVRVLKSAAGQTWLADELVELMGRFGIARLHANDDGPARDVTAALRRRGVEVDVLNGKDYATACGAWLRRARQGGLTWDGSPVLFAAMEAAVTRPIGDALAFSARHSAGPIDALVAGAVAVRAALLAPPPMPKPEIR